MSDTPIYDSLTSAYSRALLSEQLHIEVERARRYTMPCSILLFDLDHFKSINDAFGHVRGDLMLIEVARRVRATIRATDQLFRYGGDEFVVLLPNTAKSDAVHLAQRLLDTVRAYPFEGTPTLSLTLSLGVATCPDDAHDEQALLEKADARNYAAKRRGRACVMAEDDSEAATLPFAVLSRLIERDDVLKQANDFLAALVAQQRGVLDIVGRAGTGRSRFLAEVEARARLHGFDVLSVRGNRALKAQPYGVLKAIRQELLGTQLGHLSAATFSEALRRRLAAHAHDRLLVSIDDLPDLDWGTLDLLRQLLGISTLPVLGFVYTTDPESTRLAAPFAASLHERVMLQPLSRNGLHIWLRALMQWELPADFIDWLKQQTHGVPAQVEQMLRYLLERGALVRHATGWMLATDYATLNLNGLADAHRLPPHNLPAALTSFIGRERELAEVRQILATTRLLTLTGAGGAGKTRLSLQVAGELLDTFRDGVWFIDLAPLTNPALVTTTIAAVLGVREEHGRPLLTTLMDWLRPKQLLGILDNCEHLIDACAQFADTMLRACPQLRILASSREALDIEGETSYRVPSLSLPPISRPFNAYNHSAATGNNAGKDIGQFEAVRLFIDRALTVQPTFESTPEVLEAVAEICQRLDGIPLALELAAARVKTLTATQIVAQLDDRFNLLTSGKRMALPRQQTLRALIDWSHNLLSEPERFVLRRLSVFVGGWTRAAAETVCCVQSIDDSPAASALLPTDVYELLTQLVDKSLVVLDEHAAEPRYRMLETVRQYAHEKMLEAHEEAHLRDRHLNYYLQLAEQVEPIVISVPRAEWLPHLEADHDNLRAALEWACERDIEKAGWLAGTLGWFWFLGDHLNEGRAWYIRVLALAEHRVSGRHHAKALCSAGMLSTILGQLEEARHWLEQSVALCRALGEQRLRTEAVLWLGYMTILAGHDDRACDWFAEHEALLRGSASAMTLCCSLTCWGRALSNAHGDYIAAKALHDEGVALGRSMQNPTMLGIVFVNLGHWAAEQGDYAAAYAYFLESLTWRRQEGTQVNIAVASHYVADMLSMQGEYQQALPLYTEALALLRALGDQNFIAMTSYRLGYLETHQGQYRRAAAHFAEAFTIYRVLKDSQLLNCCLAGCAELRRTQGHLAQAARLLGYIAAHPQGALRIFIEVVERIEYERTVSALREQLDASTFNTAWANGQSMTIEQAIATALNETSV